MARSRPTKDEQRVLYNHFTGLICQVKGQVFTALPENAPIQFDVPEIFSALVELKGLKCQVPLCTGRSKNFVLEHINGNDDDWRPDNLRIGCRSCNQKEIKHQARVPLGNSSALEKEITSATKSATANNREAAEQLVKTAPIFVKSKDYKRAVRIYLAQKTAHGQSIKWKLARADIIALTGMSRGKADEYLLDLTESQLQPFQTIGDESEPDPWISKRVDCNLDRLPEEDRKAYREAEYLIDIETRHTLQEQAEKTKDLEQELAASQLQIQIIKQLGHVVAIEELAIKPLEYLANPAKYKGDGINSPICLKCSKRKPMLDSQLVCDSCKAEYCTTKEVATN